MATVSEDLGTRSGTDAGSRNTQPTGGMSGGRTPTLSGRDVSLGWILSARIAFGGTVGIAFPALVTSMINLEEGQEIPFGLACIVAGFCVGGFTYGVSKFTLYRANRRLAVLAAYDPLTKLVNRREFVRALGSELVRAERTGEQVSLIIADLDHFKAINDTHGHLVGDDVLVSVAGSLTRSVRPFDIVSRIGGEEFAVVLPHTDKREATLVAERVRALVALTGSDDLPGMTISSGVATFPEDAQSLRLLTMHADDAMYAAKRGGRNTVRTWSTELSPVAAGI